MAAQILCFFCQMAAGWTENNIFFYMNSHINQYYIGFLSRADLFLSNCMKESKH